MLDSVYASVYIRVMNNNTTPADHNGHPILPGDDVVNARRERIVRILRVEAVSSDRIRVRDGAGSFTIPARTVIAIRDGAIYR